MRCPKCGYISFDYNQVCPKCGKDVTAEREKMNLPSFKPEPPSLLAALTGEANDFKVVHKTDTASGVEAEEQEMDSDLEETTAITTGEMAFDEVEDLDLGLGPEQAGQVKETGDEEEEISLDLGDLSVEEPESEKGAVMETAQGEGEFMLDLGESSPDDSGAAAEAEDDESVMKSEESGIETDSFFLEDGLEGKDESKDAHLPSKGAKNDMIELKLDDLKVGESGDLEISGEAESPDAPEDAWDIGDLALDETIPEKDASEEKQDKKKEPAIDMETLTLDEEGISESKNTEEEELSIDLENLDVELDLEDSDRKPS